MTEAAPTIMMWVFLATSIALYAIGRHTAGKLDKSRQSARDMATRLLVALRESRRLRRAKRPSVAEVTAMLVKAKRGGR